MNRPAVEILWLSVLLALCIIMGVLLTGGGILLYLAPRMLGIVWFGFGVLALLSVHQAYRVLKCIKGQNDDRTVRLYGLIFLVPVVLMLTTPPDETTPQQLPHTGLALQQAQPVPTDKQQAQTPTPDPEQTPEQTAVPEEEQGPPANTPQSTNDQDALLPCTLTEGRAAFDTSDDRFADYMYTPTPELQGERITLSGFVYKDASFPEGTLLISRLYISCCVADATVTGFHIKVHDTDDFEEGEWITAEGKVDSVLIDFDGTGYEFPVLTDGTVVRCDAPPLEYTYIYP